VGIQDKKFGAAIIANGRPTQSHAFLIRKTSIDQVLLFIKQIEEQMQF